MQFHPLLRNADDRVFLIHAEVHGGQLQAGLMVVDGFVDDGWIAVSDVQCLEGLIYEVQLPPEVLQQPRRYKGYDVVLPLRHPA
jgi:hypothetical protein